MYLEQNRKEKFSYIFGEWLQVPTYATTLFVCPAASRVVLC